MTSGPVPPTSECGRHLLARENGGLFVLCSNIIPDSVELVGTVRTFDAKMQEDIHARIKRTAQLAAQSAGASAEVEILRRYPNMGSDERLVERMLPSLQRVAGPARVKLVRAQTVAEDFGFFAQQVPGIYVYLGVAPKGTPPEKVAPNHSPQFFVDESALVTGTRTLASLAVDFLSGKDVPLPAATRRR